MVRWILQVRRGEVRVMAVKAVPECCRRCHSCAALWVSFDWGASGPVGAPSELWPHTEGVVAAIRMFTTSNTAIIAL